MQDLLIFSGNSNRALAKKICSYADVPLGNAIVSSFSDGESRVEIESSVRGRDVFIVQSFCHPANHQIMEALILGDAAVRASADRVTLVVPYFGYARQERKSAPRTPISAKLVANLIEAAGFNRVLTLELHTSALQGFFDIPVDHLYSKPVFAEYFGHLKDYVIVSPDAGGTERARALAKLFDCNLAIIDKRRERPNESSVMNIIGDVKGYHALLVDDICDTAGSLTKAAEAVLNFGALSVSAVVTHPVLSGPAVQRIAQSPLKELIVTDSIPLSEEARACPKITQLSVAELLGKAIRRIHRAESVSNLFI